MEEWGDYDGGEDDAEERPVWKRPVLWAALAAVLVAVLAIGYVVTSRSDDSGDAAGASSSTLAAGSTPGTSTTVPTVTGAPVTAARTSTSVTPSSSALPTTVAPTTTAASTTAATTTEATTAPTESTVGAPPAGAPTYSTLPDGSPAPVIAVFGTDSNTLTGAVPTQAAKDKLQALMIAYSKNPVPVTNLLTIDPTVPIGVGVRVVELTSARFEPNSATVQGPHALELDRVVSVMNALPNITALVIGHADQIGSQGQNFKISSERAAAVVTYIVSKGIDPQRLSSRAVGDTDLLTLNDDAASLALNRRTEFVLYGLLGE